MLKKIDWKFLKRPLIIFFILVSSSLVFYFGGTQYKDIQNEQFTNAKNALSASHRALNNKSKEIALVDDYLEPYKTLVDNAFIGDERRLSWIESIKATNKEIKLPKFNYTISAQTPFNRPGIKKNKRVKVHASKMTLDLGLLHEEDLFNVFKMLDEHVQSYFIVDACNMTIGKNSELSVDKQNISARCVVNWVHLKVAKK